MFWTEWEWALAPVILRPNRDNPMSDGGRRHNQGASSSSVYNIEDALRFGSSFDASMLATRCRLRSSARACRPIAAVLVSGGASHYTFRGYRSADRAPGQLGS
jgi:hypothetical protein